MRPINLFSAAQRTAKSALPHQQAAWNLLQAELTRQQLEDFAELFNSEPPVKLPLQQDPSIGPSPR